MFILTDSISGLLRELATAGHMEVEMDGERLRVTVDYGSKKLAVRNAGSSRHAPKEPSKPRFGGKPGRQPAPRYKTVNGKRCRVFAYNGEELTSSEWAKKYGISAKAMDARLRHHGTPETVRNHSKSDKTSLKSRIGGAQ